MLVYDGHFNLDNIELIQRVAAQQHSGIQGLQEQKQHHIKVLGLNPPASRQRLIRNRACALVVLLTLNAFTYYTIATLFGL
ncbi:hypothetical protein [Marinagarivorans algicola]|uniref:hypothetical protein n=1 Tax=Marinagarivorans algicola TaxID=1513270 RepID=UPI0006B56079|nr:hypothetical protein [Marinagarivorans algicola]